MKQFIFRSKYRTLALVALLIPAPSYAAATLDDVVIAIKQVYTFLDTQMLTNNWLGPQPNLQQTQSNNNTAATVNNSMSSLTATGSSSNQAYLAIASVLGPNPNPSIGASMLAFPAGDTLTSGSSSQSQSVLNGIYGSCGDNAFNYEMFISPSVYSKMTLPCAPNDQDISAYAKAYIQYAADLGNPISTYSLNQLVTDNTVTPDQATTISNSAEYQDFAQSRRHIVAAQSAGLSNLYYLAQLRMPNSNNVSALSLSDAVAYSRTNPPTNGSTNWYMQMQTALPAMVARETLFVLAEMQRDMHDMRKENQRLIAVLSMMQLSTLSASKQILNVKLTQVQNKVAAVTAPPPSSSSSSSSTNGSSTTSVGGYTLPSSSNSTKDVPKVDIPAAGSP